MSDPLKRVCDHDKYKIVPCPNAGQGLMEYFNTMLKGGGWAYLCRECTVEYGHIHSDYTEHFVWFWESGCYQNVRRAANAEGI